MHGLPHAAPNRPRHTSHATWAPAARRARALPAPAAIRRRERLSPQLPTDRVSAHLHESKPNTHAKHLEHLGEDAAARVDEARVHAAGEDERRLGGARVVVRWVHASRRAQVGAGEGHAQRVQRRELRRRDGHTREARVVGENIMLGRESVLHKF
jgi:hypothetical protein